MVGGRHPILSNCMIPIFKSKYDLINHFAKLGFTKGAEIGVAEGYFSEAMFKAIPNLELFCVDLWEVYKGNRWGGSQERNDHHFKASCERLEKYNSHIIRGKSMDVVKNCPDESLDFVYIDANHSFDYVMQDLIEWSKKVRKGGIVALDDYYAFKGAGVIEAVDAYCKAHGIVPNFTDPYTDKIQDRGSQEQANAWWVKE